MRHDVVGDGGRHHVTVGPAAAVVRHGGARRAISTPWVVPQVLRGGALPALGLVEPVVVRGRPMALSVARAGLRLPTAKDVAISEQNACRAYEIQNRQRGWPCNRWPSGCCAIDACLLRNTV